MLLTYIPSLTCIQSNLLLSHISLILLCRFWSLLETKEHVAKCYRRCRKWAVYVHPFIHSYLVYLFISAFLSRNNNKNPYCIFFFPHKTYTDSMNEQQQEEGQFIIAGPLFLIPEATIATDRQALHKNPKSNNNLSNQLQSFF